jgi:hypothetical protein
LDKVELLEKIMKVIPNLWKSSLSLLFVAIAALFNTPVLAQSAADDASDALRQLGTGGFKAAQGVGKGVAIIGAKTSQERKLVGGETTDLLVDGFSGVLTYTGRVAQHAGKVVAVYKPALVETGTALADGAGHAAVGVGNAVDKLSEAGVKAVQK